ncbi:MazG-like protein [Streptococcus sp. H49]|uniref:MazG-like protein n=1 Tax=Streptococcus huangxiaojuni TaxID=3237239 RepID=UPI0034A5131A
MLLEELLQRSHSIREVYHQLEKQHHGSKWSVEEDLLAMTNDVGNVTRLVMTKKRRYYDETPYQLESKLAELIWWVAELSQRLDIDLQEALEQFLSDKEQLLKIDDDN